MKTNEKTNRALTLSLPVSKDDGASSMPEAFAGMFQAGFESGYHSGREAGYQKGFVEGYAAVHQGPNNGAALDPDTRKARAPGAMQAVEGKSAPKVGPRRMLLGMPCKTCRVYLMRDETHCPSCKQPVRMA
jgi:hypothetical protein